MDIITVKHMMLYKALWVVTYSSMYIWSRPFWLSLKNFTLVYMTEVKWQWIANVCVIV